MRAKGSLIILTLFATIRLSASDSFQFFSAKSEIEITANGSTESFTAFFRYKPEDSLWISFTGTLGIEGMRMLITKDSTYIINRIDKSRLKYSNKEENSILPIALDLEDWKMLLFNKMYTPDSSTLIVKADENMSYTYYCEDNTKCLMISPENNIKKASFLTSGLQCTVVFDQFRPFTSLKKIAYSRVVDIISETEYWKMKIVFDNHNLDKPFSLPFDFAKQNK